MWIHWPIRPLQCLQCVVYVRFSYFKDWGCLFLSPKKHVTVNVNVAPDLSNQVVFLDGNCKQSRAEPILSVGNVAVMDEKCCHFSKSIITFLTICAQQTIWSLCHHKRPGLNDIQTNMQMETRQTGQKRCKYNISVGLGGLASTLLLEAVVNINNFVILLGKLCKCGKCRLEVINYSNFSLESCCLHRAGPYNMHVRSYDETTL